MAEYDLSGINLPYSLDAEQSVLGAILMDSNALSEVSDALQPEHFHITLNRQIYEVLIQMGLSSAQIDVVTVLDACMRQGVFETAEQAKEYLTRLMTAVPSISSVGKYAKIVTEKYLLRSLIFAAKEIIDAANEGAEDAETLVDFAEQKIFDIRSGQDRSELTHISGIVFDRVNELNQMAKAAAANNGNPVMTGLETMFKELDRRIFGLNKSDLIIIAGRPGMGKTSFAMNIATNVAKKYRDKDVCVFNLEMSKEQIVSRMLSSEAMLPSEENGQSPAEQVGRYHAVRGYTVAAAYIH